MSRKRSAKPVTLPAVEFTRETSEQPAAIPTAPTAADMRRPMPVVPEGERPNTDAIEAIVVGGLNPDSVLVRVRMPDGAITYAGAARAQRPIDHLRHNLPPRQRIGDVHVRAAEIYAALDADMGRTGSNTAAIMQNAIFSVPLEKWEKDIYKDDPFMSVGEAPRMPHQDDAGRVQTMFRRRRVRERLPREYVAVLDDLIVRELSVGAISRRWGVSPEGMGLVVRFALWNLVRVLNEVDAEFQAWWTSHQEAQSG